MIFVDDQVVQPNNPAVLGYENHNTDVGCILGSRIAPPRTIGSLKRAICRTEKFTDLDAFDIYSTANEQGALDETQTLSLDPAELPGTDPNDPVVLVNKPLPTVNLKEHAITDQNGTLKKIHRVICGQCSYILDSNWSKD